MCMSYLCKVAKGDFTIIEVLESVVSIRIAAICGQIVFGMENGVLVVVVEKNEALIRCVWHECDQVVFALIYLIHGVSVFL